jgi:hypothetical protein
MRLLNLTLAGMLLTAPIAAAGQSPDQSSSTQTDASAPQDAGALPVSLDKIKRALAQAPAEPLRGLDEHPHFRIGVSEQQTMRVEDLIASLDFTSGPAAAGGLYGYEVNQQAFPSVDNPLRQPYAAFNQPELLTIVVENLAVKYLGGRALTAVSRAQRARAEQAARDEVLQAIVDYQATQETAQPATGATLKR